MNNRRTLTTFSLGAFVGLLVFAGVSNLRYGALDAPQQASITSPHAFDHKEYFEITLAVPIQNWNLERHRQLSSWNYTGLTFTALDWNNNGRTDDEIPRFLHLYQFETPNVWTNTGMNRTAHKLGNSAANNTSSGGYQFARHVSVHTSIAAGNCAFTSTTIANEQAASGLTRAIGTFATGTASAGDITWNITNSFSVTGTVSAINATGLWTNTAGGTAEILFACGQFVPTSVVSGDTLQIRHSSAMTQASILWWLPDSVVYLFVASVITHRLIASRNKRWITSI